MAINYEAPLTGHLYQITRL